MGNTVCDGELLRLPAAQAGGPVPREQPRDAGDGRDVQPSDRSVLLLHAADQHLPHRILHRRPAHPVTLPR
eukprot:3886871-Pyramimonas_sp.AAC.1